MLETSLHSAAIEPDIVVDACWKSIGTRGDQSCPLLQQYFRCLNCPTYATAAAKLLDRPVPAAGGAHADLRWQGTEEQAKKHAEDRTNGAAVDASLLIFRLGAEWLALPTVSIVEVIEPRAVHSLPHQTNPAVLGLTNIRGALKICVALSRLLGIDGSNEKSALRALVVEHEQQILVFPVDEVAGVHGYASSSLQAPPSTVQLTGAAYTRAILSWREHQLGLLDCGLLFYALNRSMA